MAEFLTFVLSAPLAAMGDVAVGEWRGGRDRPARSALLGLVAGCLGLLREDEAAHARLQSAHGLALQVQGMGPGLTDYHTAQLAEPRRGVRHRNRLAELSVPGKDLKTVLSRREYRTDALVLAALWRRGEEGWALDELAGALRRPVFIPYFGRKSCPLDRPMAPLVEEAANPIAALAARCAAEGMGRPLTTVLDAADARAWGLDDRLLRIEHRRDAIASRARWQFALRQEAVLRQPDAP